MMMSGKVRGVLLLALLVLWGCAVCSAQGEVVRTARPVDYKGRVQFVLPVGVVALSGAQLDSVVGEDKVPMGELMMLAYAPPPVGGDTLSYLMFGRVKIPLVMALPLKWAMRHLAKDNGAMFREFFDGQQAPEGDTLAAARLRSSRIEQWEVVPMHGGHLVHMGRRDLLGDTLKRRQASVFVKLREVIVLYSEYALADSAQWHGPFREMHESFRVRE